MNKQEIREMIREYEQALGKTTYIYREIWKAIKQQTPDDAIDLGQEMEMVVDKVLETL